MEGEGERTFIVVGVDGSSNADRALGWAIAEAQEHSSPVRIVTAWQVPLVGYSGHGHSPPAGLSLEETVREMAEKIANGAAAKVREQADVPVETRVVEGGAAEALIDEAGAEDRLVIGARSKPTIPLILASSVSVQCALHARCPTTIVH
jgi:nucleotide-binding universal stress UspA family protein